METFFVIFTYSYNVLILCSEREPFKEKQPAIITKAAFVIVPILLKQVDVILSAWFIASHFAHCKSTVSKGAASQPEKYLYKRSWTSQWVSIH